MVKIAAAMGAMREGAVHAGVRKALAEGIAIQEIEQLVPLVAGTIGLPSAVACWSWVLDALNGD
jgi:alkylhydroperoxidase/carboxymuconolactone decarboxylase family protein YurZ